MIPYYQDAQATLFAGEARSVLATIPDESVQSVVTSPPYWGLRNYGLEASVWGGRDHKHRWGAAGPKRRTGRDDLGPNRHVTSGMIDSQKGDGRLYAPSGDRCPCGAWRGALGLEPDPEMYVEHLLEVFAHIWRVLRKDGTLWLNLGDAYNAGTRRDRRPSRTLNGYGKHGYWSNPMISKRVNFDGLKVKDLIGMPWRIAFALQAAGWYLRADIIWSKPNPMPESVVDRPTKAHEYLFLMTKSPRYYYDADAIRTALRPKTYTTYGAERHDPGDGSGLFKSENFGHDLPIRRPRIKMPDGWDTSDGGHGSFHRDGREKGKVVDKQRGHGRRHAGFNDRWDHMTREEQQEAGANARSVWEIATQPYPDAHFATFPPALIKPCILAGAAEGTTVLDPFVGSGTTCFVAKELGRTSIGIDLNTAYLDLAVKRLVQETLWGVR